MNKHNIKSQNTYNNVYWKQAIDKNQTHRQSFLIDWTAPYGPFGPRWFNVTLACAD